MTKITVITHSDDCNATEMTMMDDDAHCEKEVGPAGVEVDRQLDQRARVSWETIKVIINPQSTE